MYMSTANDGDNMCAQAQAHERLQQRAAAAKLRKHKRKSADLEPPQPAPSFSLTASAHTHVANAPRCPSFHHPRSTHLFERCSMQSAANIQLHMHIDRQSPALHC